MDRVSYLFMFYTARRIHHNFTGSQEQNQILKKCGENRVSLNIAFCYTVFITDTLISME